MSNRDPHFFPAKFNDRTPSSRQTLRRLFFLLFLRGQIAPNHQQDKVPRSIAAKLSQSLFISAMCGLMALGLYKYSPFVLSVYLHAMTFTLTGMMLAGTTGGILFNKEEADILLHRPVEMKDLLRAKISVLLEYSLWISLAFNLVGFGVGLIMPGGGWRFVLAHFLSVIMESIFCAGCVVTVYQLCLRWCGRERLENVITFAQVGLTVLFVLSSQFLPQVALRGGLDHLVETYSNWLILLPPAWFAEFDHLISGTFAWHSILSATLAVVGTLFVVWLAFAKLANEFEGGLQKLSEHTTRVAVPASGRRWVDRIADFGPMRWWLRDPVQRASFVLTSVYLTRDRDAKLRIYPSVLPMMVMPFILMFNELNGPPGQPSGFGLAMVGAFLGQIPALAIATLNQSQQWQASEIFQIAPLAGPGAICHGARKAVLAFMMLPISCVMIAISFLIAKDLSTAPLLIPGLLMAPINSLLPYLEDKSTPLSHPVVQAKAQVNLWATVATMFLSLFVAMFGFMAWIGGVFPWFIGAEAIGILWLIWHLASRVDRRVWPVA